MGGLSLTGKQAEKERQLREERFTNRLNVAESY